MYLRTNCRVSLVSNSSSVSGRILYVSSGVVFQPLNPFNPVFFFFFLLTFRGTLENSVSVTNTDSVEL